jgi:hypothetical protein
MALTKLLLVYQTWEAISGLIIHYLSCVGTVEVEVHNITVLYKMKGIIRVLCPFISYLPSVDELEFDVEQLSTVLYPWQTHHVLTDWEDSHSYITEKLHNPKSPLHRFYKDGNLVTPVSWAQSQYLLYKIFRNWF